ncbi:recombination regulator RecX [Treponema primitia]|uniref:regulatory protein RecX n=1 Tax=Treponema primitia TaxID=88058 RepID=UPI0039808212
MVVASLKTTETKAGPVILRIGLSDGSLFSLNSVYLLHPFQGDGYFSPNKEISPEEETSLRFAADCFRAERAALRLVARAEQTRAGITRKLEQRGHGSSQVRAAVSYLTDLEIVDDRRFAERWIQSRLYRGADSPLRLVTALCQRGISREIAKSACKAILDFEKETNLLQKFISKRHPLTANSFREDRFLKGQLKREGFSNQALEWYWEDQ